MNWRQWFYSAVCTGLLGVLMWTNATGYVLFGATKSIPSHSASTYHK
jgi:hypothetical protein